MKTFIVLASLFLSPFAFATDYGHCAPTYKVCAEQASCSSFYTCQRREHAFLNYLILTAIDETELDQSAQCAEARNNLETSIEAHALTIECVDTENGPQFGG